MIPPHNNNVQRILLDRLRFQVSQAVDLEMIELRSDVYADQFSRMLVMHLRADLLGRRVREETKDDLVAEYPADWWQALRARFLPKWWLYRWPVQTRKVYHATSRQRYHVCPHIRMPGKEQQYCFPFLASDGGPKWWEPEV